MRVSEVRQSALINATDDIVLLKDADFRHIIVNEGAQKFFNKPEAELLGKTDFDLMPEENAKTCRASDLQALQEGRLVINIEEVGGRFFESRKFPVQLGGQRAVGAFIRDITSEKQGEELILLKSRQISILNEMGLALAQTQGLTEILRTAYSYLQQIADCPIYSISLIDPSGKSLEVYYVFADGKEQDISQLPALPIDKRKHAGRSGAINDARTVIIDDLEAEIKKAKTTFFVGDPSLPKSAVYTPLIVNNRVIGLLELQSYQKSAYTREITEILGTAANQIGMAVENSRFSQTQQLQTKALNAAANAILITDENGTIIWTNPAFSQLTGYAPEEAVGNNPRELVRSGMQPLEFYQQLWETIRRGDVWQGTLINRRKDGSQYIEEMTITPLREDQTNITRYIAIKQDVTEREQHERELTVVANVSSALRVANTRSEMLPVILDQLLEQFGVDAAMLVLRHPASDEMVIELGWGKWTGATGQRIPSGQGLSRQIMNSGEVYIDNDIRTNNEVYFPALFEDCRCTAAVSLLVEEQPIGALFIGSNREFQERDGRLLKSVADIAANALHRSTLHEQTREKVNQLNSLRIIDQAINTSLDLRVTLNVILKQSGDLLGADAMAVYIIRTHVMWLEPLAHYGFQSKEVEASRLPIGQGLAGQSILERRIVSTPDDAAQFTEPAYILEGFKSMHCAPLLVKGHIKGVMLACFRKAFNPPPDWMDVFQTLATQSAIAIDNHELFDGLQRSTVNLAVAYNETIEGWAKALELRDQETEGHSQRVTQLAIHLANEVGIRDEALDHFMRGALLHDIGKMGIPDAILNKPGKLTEAEMDQVREHPRKAYEMLSAIKYLQPALEVPFGHHEKWDGSGYPRGLKGEDIPLSARVFAVVDVWDALTSDRPYRKAWSRQQAVEYIQQQAGSHFDPHIVEVFLNRILTKSAKTD